MSMKIEAWKLTASLNTRVNHHLNQFRFSSDVWTFTVQISIWIRSELDNFRRSSDPDLNFFWTEINWKGKNQFRLSSDLGLNFFWNINRIQVKSGFKLLISYDSFECCEFSELQKFLATMSIYGFLFWLWIIVYDGICTWITFYGNAFGIFVANLFHDMWKNKYIY